MSSPSFNGKTKPKTFWRWRSKTDSKAWEYSQGVGHAILTDVSIFDIPDNAEVKSGYWTKTRCARLGCGCRVSKWITTKIFKAKTLKLRTRKNIVLAYE